MIMSRRSFVAGAMVSAMPLRAAAQTTSQGMRVILLGTKGGPTPSAARAAASVAIVIDGRLYLLDCPNGVAGQLAKAAIRLDQLSQVFVTHNHSDHVVDAGSLLVLA